MRLRLKVWHRKQRYAIRQQPAMNSAYRVAVGVVGGLMVLAGMVMIPLPIPGPGWGDVLPRPGRPVHGIRVGPPHHDVHADHAAPRRSVDHAGNGLRRRSRHYPCPAVRGLVGLRARPSRSASPPESDPVELGAKVRLWSKSPQVTDIERFLVG